MARTRIITSKRILEIVSEVTEIPIERIKEKVRRREIVDARKVAAYMMYEYTTLSLSTIAQTLGMESRRHDTIIYYKKKMGELIDSGDRLGVVARIVEDAIIQIISGHPNMNLEDAASRGLTRDKFVSKVVSSIDWKEKGTTVKNLNTLYYKLFKEKEIA